METKELKEKLFYKKVSVYEKANDEATEKAIFTLRGVSYSEFADKDGKFSITQGYSINRTAYNNYVSYGKTLEYGIVVAGKSYSGTQPLTVVDGAVTALNEKVYMTSQSKIAHDYIDIKVTGITADNNGAELIMCLFAFDGASVSYLNNIDNSPCQTNEAETIIINLAK